MQQINKKRRFNVIDLLICVIILVVIAFAAYIFVFSGASANETTSNTVNIQYTLEVKAERDELISHAEKNVGKAMIDGASKYNLGQVVDFYYSGSRYSGWDAESGESVASDYPEHSDLSFVVNATAEKNPANGRYSINGFDISVGTLVYVRLPDYTGTSYCTQITELK
ncbi:MAG: DUF4330 domain-containing protein [Ruminococcaceae bacterium]|nr:DUF4330 domain-containing protein [Oscillospiraceae bacterium]